MTTDSGKVAVIGAGAIGCATAGYLAHKGLEVSICDVNPGALESMKRNGKVRLCGVLDYEAPIACATTDVAEAIDGACLVITAVPASVHEAVARSVAAHLRDDTLLLIQPGQTLSAVAFLHAARQAGMKADVTCAETLSAFFAATVREPGVVEVHGIKRYVPFAVLPAARTEEVSTVLEPLFEVLTPWSSILEIGLHNPNAVVHPPVTLLNMGLVDNARPFRFYKDGASKHVVKLAEAVDRERLEILRSLGLPGISLTEWLDRAYGYGRADLYQTIQANVPYWNIPGPTTINTRLLLEDIPTGLVPFCDIARMAGVETPTMKAIVQTCCAFYDNDFWETGRTLSRFGMDHLDREGLLRELGPATAST